MKEDINDTGRKRTLIERPRGKTALSVKIIDSKTAKL